MSTADDFSLWVDIAAYVGGAALAAVFLCPLFWWGMKKTLNEHA